MFLSHEDHAQFLSEQVQAKPKHVIIASFGIYAGITYTGQDTTEWGEKYHLATRDLLESMRKLPDARFLIGAANYRSCKGKVDCIDCEKQYCRTLIRLVNHAEMFPEFQWRVSTSLHLKCALFFWDKKNSGVAGGRNFTDSDWSDCTFELSAGQIECLYEYVDYLWDKSRLITNETVAMIFEEEEISQRGFAATVSGVSDEDSEVPF